MRITVGAFCALAFCVLQQAPAAQVARTAQVVQPSSRLFKVCSASVPPTIRAEMQREKDAVNRSQRAGAFAALQDLGDASSIFQSFQTRQGAIITPDTWTTGTTLKVKFLSGDVGVTQRIEASAKAWEQAANIHFQFVSPNDDADIRIKVDSDNNSWSYVGKEAQQIAKDQETMHFGWLHSEDSQADYDSVVLHEFGHALGLIHEHQSPAGGIQWDEDAVYQYAQTQFGWPKDKAKANIIDQYSGDDAIFTRLDPESIMMYAFPAEWTKNKVSMPWNFRLSKSDLMFIGRIYANPSH